MTRTLFASIGLLAFAPASALASTVAIPGVCDPGKRVSADDDMCACYYKAATAESDALTASMLSGTFESPTYEDWENGFTLGTGPSAVTLPASATSGSCYEIDTHVMATGASMDSRNRVTKKLYNVGDRASTYWGHTFDFTTSDSGTDGDPRHDIATPGTDGFIAFGTDGSTLYDHSTSSGYTMVITPGLSELRDSQHNVIGTVDHGTNEIKGVVLDDFDGDGFLDVEFMMQDTRILTAMGNGSAMQMFIIQ